MSAMQSTNRITKRAAKPETQWNPDDRVCLGPAAEPIKPAAPFVQDSLMIVAPGLKPRFFKSAEECNAAAYDFAESHPGVWVEVYGRVCDMPGWLLVELIGVPVIDTMFNAASWIRCVTVDDSSLRT